MFTGVVIYDGESRDECWPEKSFGLNPDVTFPYLELGAVIWQYCQSLFYSINSLVVHYWLSVIILLAQY